MFNDTVALATAWLNVDKLGGRPARTLLIGAAVLTVRQLFGSWSFDLLAESATVTDNPASVMTWLGERLARPERLLIWRAEDIAVPSLVAAAETAADTVAAAKLLRGLDRAFGAEVIDVAADHGGSRATSFDAVAHAAGLPFVAMNLTDLAEAHRLMDHGLIRDHLTARAKAIWRLWLLQQQDEALTSATENWLAEHDREAQQ